MSHSENPEFNELMDAFCSLTGRQSGKYWMKRSNPFLMMNLKKEKTNKDLLIHLSSHYGFTFHRYGFIFE